MGLTAGAAAVAVLSRAAVADALSASAVVGGADDVLASEPVEMGTRLLDNALLLNATA